MAPASNEEQFKFLISCIRYSNNGKASLAAARSENEADSSKVDFGQVAKECSIVSKGAAAKRYERMMRTHGIASNAATVKPAVGRPAKMERHDSQSPSGYSSSNGCKRKADQFIEDLNPADDEEGFGANFNVKVETRDFGPRYKQQMHVKEENDQKHLVQQRSQLKLEDAHELLKYYPPTSGGHTMADIAQDDLYGSDGHSGEISAPGGFSSPQRYGHRVNMAGFGASPHPSRYVKHNFDYVPGFGSPSISGYNGNSGIGGMTISPAEMADFQAISYHVDSRGRADSPIVVDDGFTNSCFN